MVKRYRVSKRVTPTEMAYYEMNPEVLRDTLSDSLGYYLRESIKPVITEIEDGMFECSCEMALIPAKALEHVKNRLELGFVIPGEEVFASQIHYLLFGPKNPPSAGNLPSD